MIAQVLRGSWRRRPAQLGMVFTSVLMAACAAAILGAFSARSGARLAEDLRGFGPNLLVRPQVGGPRALPQAELARVAAIPGVLAVAPVLESDDGSRLVVAAMPSLLALHPSWRLSGRWPRGEEILLGVAVDPAQAAGRAVSGSLETGDRYDRAWFRELRGEDLVERLEVRVLPDRLGEVARAVPASVAGAEAVPLARVSESEARLSRRLGMLLGALGVLSVALALLAVVGATSALLGERRSEIGLLLALGYTARRIALAHAIELVAVAAIAAAVGSLGGEWAAAGLADRVLGPATAAPLWTPRGAAAAVLAACLVAGTGVVLVVVRLGRMDAALLLRGD
jgi:hypothetical protein